MRVLIASSRNWTSVARLASTLRDAGIEPHLLDSGDTQASSSLRFASRTVIKGAADSVARATLDVGERFEHILACDEPLLLALVAMDDRRADRVLPAPADVLPHLLDKTLFTHAAENAGLRVPASIVACDKASVAEAVAKLGPHGFLKARQGYAGLMVRAAKGRRQAVKAAAELHYPVLVQERMTGLLGLMPCVFDRGVLVAALAAEKYRTITRFGPSSVNRLLPMTPSLSRTAELLGLAFGLHGFASVDYFAPVDGGEPVVVEVNPRPVSQLHIGKLVGVDMAAAYREVCAGNRPPLTLSQSERLVRLFPQELRRLRTRHGGLGGLARWMLAEGAIDDVPWRDASLVTRHFLRDD